jgi:hypothetical protein
MKKITGLLMASAFVGAVLSSCGDKYVPLTEEQKTAKADSIFTATSASIQSRERGSLCSRNASESRGQSSRINGSCSNCYQLINPIKKLEMKKALIKLSALATIGLVMASCSNEEANKKAAEADNAAIQTLVDSKTANIDAEVLQHVMLK